MLKPEVRGSRRRGFLVLALVLPAAAIGALAALAIVPRVALPRPIAARPAPPRDRYAAPDERTAPACGDPTPRTHLVVPVTLTGATATTRGCTIAAWGGSAVYVSRDNGATFDGIRRGGAPITAVAIDEYSQLYIARDDATLEVSDLDGTNGSIHGTPVPLETLTARDGIVAGTGRLFHARPIEIAVSADRGASWKVAIPDPSEPMAGTSAIDLDAIGTLWVASVGADETLLWRTSESLGHLNVAEREVGGTGAAIGGGVLAVVGGREGVTDPFDRTVGVTLPRAIEAASNGAIVFTRGWDGSTWRLDGDRVSSWGNSPGRLVAVDPHGVPLFLDANGDLVRFGTVLLASTRVR